MTTRRPQPRIPLLNDRRTGATQMTTMTRSEFGKVELEIIYCVP